MAYLAPALNTTAVAASDGHAAELETLDQLRRRLSSAYTVFHGVHWTRGHASTAAFGEADFIIVNQAGALLVIEQKKGAIEEGLDGLTKRYDGKPKSVSAQIHRTIDGLRDKFKRQTGHALDPDYLLYCPDHRVLRLEAAGLDGERIVDARDATKLPERIAAILPPGTPDPAFADRVSRFLEQQLELTPDIHAHRTAQDRHYARATGGLAETVVNISGRPLRLAVRGTAGCGKSLIAVRAFRDAVAQGKRPLLLCFNRDLKEKLKAACGDGGTVETFHGAIDRALAGVGTPINHAGGADWRKEIDRCFATALSDQWYFDTLIVDEGQDFEADWREMLELELFGHAGTNRLWLDDPDQAIQLSRAPRDREWPHEGWTGYRARCNYRSPQTIARYIKALLPFEFNVANPLPGNDVSVTRVTDRDGIAQAVGRLAAQLVKTGYAVEDIVVLSLKGAQSATLAGTSKCGAFNLRRPTGGYDLFGNQVWQDGRLRFDTIRRYKGQQDAVVILTDVDMPTEEDRMPDWQRLMFAALTRATDRVEIVASGTTADVVAGA
jgi:hypothetical protein